MFQSGEADSASVVDASINSPDRDVSSFVVITFI